MAWINKLPCPRADCDSSDAFGYNTETHAGYCFSCGKSSFVQEGDEPVKQFNDPVPTREAPPQANYAYHALRGIDKDTMEFYGVKTLMASDGTPIRQEYVYPSGG